MTNEELQKKFDLLVKEFFKLRQTFNLTMFELAQLKKEIRYLKEPKHHRG